MNRWKLSALVVALAVAVSLTAAGAMAADAAKTVSGKASCGGCTGVVKGCCVLLTDSAGDRWILRGDKDKLKAAFDARHDSKKKMTATYKGDATAKKGKDGKEYKEITVTEVKVGT